LSEGGEKWEEKRVRVRVRERVRARRGREEV
jgi:hypothetical protein